MGGVGVPATGLAGFAESDEGCSGKQVPGSFTLSFRWRFVIRYASFPESLSAWQKTYTNSEQKYSNWPPVLLAFCVAVNRSTDDH